VAISSDPLLLLATLWELLPVDAALNDSWVCEDDSKLFPVVVDHKVRVE